MSRRPIRFHAMLSRERLSEMLAPIQAKLRNLALSDAYRRVNESLENPALLDTVQESTWAALVEERPELDASAILDLIEKRSRRNRRYKPPIIARATEGAWTAVGIFVDRGAGVASGEAMDLLDTDEGKKLLREGQALLGKHLARELLR